MLNLPRVGLIVFFFIPALWQGETFNPTLFFQICGTAVNSEQTANWIGSLTNHDIRGVLDLSRDLINSPHLGFDEALKSYMIGTTYHIPEHRIRHALIRGRYDIYVSSSRKYLHNIFDLSAELQTSPLIGLRILQGLKDAALKHGETKSPYILKQDFMHYLTGMGLEPAAIKSWLDVMLKKALVVNYDPTCTDERSSTQIELSPTGELHLYWGKGNFDYLFAMAEITPIREKGVFDKLYNDYNQRSSLQYREFVAKLTARFVNYMLKEDQLFCHVPDHPSYSGQIDLIKKLDATFGSASFPN